MLLCLSLVVRITADRYIRSVLRRNSFFDGMPQTRREHMIAARVPRRGQQGRK